MTSGLLYHSHCHFPFIVLAPSLSTLYCHYIMHLSLCPSFTTFSSTPLFTCHTQRTASVCMLRGAFQNCTNRGTRAHTHTHTLDSLVRQIAQGIISEMAKGLSNTLNDAYQDSRTSLAPRTASYTYTHARTHAHTFCLP